MSKLDKINFEKDLIDFIDELEVKCTQEYNETRARAYNVRIEDTYAITLRDDFNKNAGKREIISKIKEKILDLLNDKEIEDE